MKAETLDPRMSPRRLFLLLLGLVLLVGFSVQRLFLADPPPLPVEIRGPIMGTTYSVKLDVPELVGEERRRVEEAVLERLDEINELMSTYDPDSELSRFNRSRSPDPATLSPLTMEALRTSEAVSRATGGAFDVTVGPLVNAWGFGAPEQPPTAPGEAELAELTARVGYELLVLDHQSGTVSKTVADLEVDLSAVAKGQAADRVSQRLTELGYSRHLVEVGGELRAGAAKADGSPWRVGIETPDATIRAVYGVVELVEQAVATSGDYRNFYELDGVEYAHLIDPRTGQPVRHAGASVSVIHRQAMVADAWATALSLLGPDEGLEVAEREGLAALFITRDGDGFAARATTIFRDRYPVPGTEG
jgi:thiamine biosynthesis lipoprotein